MHLINLIVKYLYRKYGVPLHNFFFENWTRGTSHLKVSTFLSYIDLANVVLALDERSVQGCTRVKRKTYSPLDDHWVILSAYTFFEPNEKNFAAPLTPWSIYSYFDPILKASTLLRRSIFCIFVD